MTIVLTMDLSGQEGTLCVYSALRLLLRLGSGVLSLGWRNQQHWVRTHSCFEAGAGRKCPFLLD